MADNRDAQEWMRGWQAMQKQFLESWTKIAGQPGAASATATPSMPPLTEGFEQWARAFVGTGGAGGGNEMLERVLAGARQYVQMMQSAMQQIGGGATLDANAFANAARQAMGGFGAMPGFGAMGATGGSGANPVLDAMRQATGAGARSFENLFNEFAQQAEPMKQQVMQALNLPAFGYSREQQEHHQRSAQAWADYADQLGKYNALLMRASERGLEIFETKLGERSEPGREIKSLREFYDTWIDAAEEGFAEIALSPEYRQVYGALVNAQMRVRQNTQLDVERGTGALGMPTRSEVDGTHRKVAEMRRRLARIEEHLSLDEIDAGDPANDDAPAPRAANRADTAPRATGGGATPSAARRPAAARVKTATRTSGNRGGPGRESGGAGNEQGNATSGGGPGRESGGSGNEQGTKVTKRAPHVPKKRGDRDDLVDLAKKKKLKKKPGPPGPGPSSFAERLKAQRAPARKGR